MKKQELRHDIFRENVIKAIQHFNENSSTVIKIFAVIILLIAGISYYNILGVSQTKSSAHLAGRAQNIFINGNLDEAIVKFERILRDYPKTSGATQALVYLLNNAVDKNNSETIHRLLEEEWEQTNDPVVLSAIFKIKADVSMSDGNNSNALKYYNKAESIMNGNPLHLKYQLDISSALLSEDNYDDALQILEEIINNEDVGFNEKNLAEELMAYAKQKMGI